MLQRVRVEARDDNLSLVAAGVAFYAMLAIFPAILAAVSLYALVADPDQVRAQLEPVARALPAGARDLLVGQLSTASAAGGGGLTLGLFVSLAAVLWSTSSGVQAMMTALNVIYDEDETRGALKLRATALLLTLGGLVAGLLALALVALFPVAANLIDLGAAGQVLANIARWVLLAVLVTIGLAVLYRYGPDRDRPRWRWVSWGAVIALVVWLLASAAFSFYVSNFGNYNKTYGALAAVVILLLWLFLSAYVILLGAEINAEVEHQTTVDSTTGPPEPMGERNAAVADTVGEGGDDSPEK